MILLYSPERYGNEKSDSTPAYRSITSNKVAPIDLSVVQYANHRMTRKNTEIIYPQARRQNVIPIKTVGNQSLNTIKNNNIVKAVEGKTAELKNSVLPKKNPGVFAYAKIQLTVIFFTLCASIAILAFVKIEYNENEINRLYVGYIPYDSYNEVFDYISDDVHFYISDGGSESVSLFMPYVTVKEALNNAGIELTKYDLINYPLDNIITDNMTIKVTRVHYEYTQESASVPYTVKQVNVDTIPKGTKKVVTKGFSGESVKYYENVMTNGIVTEKKLIKEEVSVKPTEEVVQVGIGGVFTAPDGTKYNYSYRLDVDAVAYGDISEGTNPKWTGVTYTGIKCRPGIIAVDPTVIPLHSNVYVVGSYGDYGVCYAADIGTAIKGNIIDIYMETKQEMINFGRRKMQAYILD